MDRMDMRCCPLAASRFRTRERVKSSSHSGLSAVMMTSQIWSVTAAPCPSVVAEADPAAGHLLAVLVQGEVQGALGPYGAFGGHVPAHQDLVVPDPHLA